MKQRVTFNRMIAAVESITVMVDESVDIDTITVDEADDIIEQAFYDNTCVVELEMVESESPHSVSHNNGKGYRELAEGDYLQQNILTRS